LRRFLGTLLTLWAVVTLTFIALYLVPGDPAQVLLSESNASAAEIAERRDELGLNDSLAVQYGRYLWRLLQGDLGRSFFTGRPVTVTILEQLPATFALAFAAMVVAVIAGLGLGLLAAARPGSWLDIIVTGLATMGISTPVFWSGLVAIWLFSLVLGWFPATGQGGLEFLTLPASVLGFSAAGAVARLTRASVLDVIDKPYIHVARSKGLPPRPMLLRHTLRVALLPVITVIGLQFGFLLGGAVVTETIFARQGLGRLVVSAILRKDYPIVLGVVLVSVVGYVTVNLITDLLYGALDPRIRKRLR
jgi:peptide/nickel transport system permease protein/oligopeptide transport system permease protein